MQCSNARLLLNEYLEKNLSAGDVARLEGHLGRCAKCRKAHADLRAVRGLLSHLPRLRAPEGFLAAVGTRIQAQEEVPARRWRPRHVYSAVGMVVLLVALAGGWRGLVGRTPPPAIDQAAAQEDPQEFAAFCVRAHFTEASTEPLAYDRGILFGAPQEPWPGAGQGRPIQPNGPSVSPGPRVQMRQPGPIPRAVARILRGKAFGPASRLLPPLPRPGARLD